jgi:glyoxylase-like metal-dependent hydrolase (beta-lactamase superfamily II)
MLSEIRMLSLPLPFRMGLVNCYLISTTTGYILIDTGSSNARKALMEQLNNYGCDKNNLNLVILTHGDFDHTGNAAYLRSTLDSKLAMHQLDSGMVERGDMFENRKQSNFLIKSLIPLFTGFGRSERFSPDILLDDGFDLASYGLDATILSLPGHSAGSIGVFIRDGELFCGDLFENVKEPGLNSIMDDLKTAVISMARLDKLNIRQVFPGHGQPFNWDDIKKNV